MSAAKLSLAAIVLALCVAGCGTVDVKRTAETGATQSRGRVDSPLRNHPDHVACLQAQHLTVRRIDGSDLAVGVAPAVVRVHFDPTPGQAQGDQISDHEQAAEVIGSALLYPGQASDAQLTDIERCIAKGVKG